jgi:hypothetical protein
MDAQAYTDAIEQRHAVRRAMKRRMTELRAAAATLSHAAGNVAVGVPTLEITADPVAQIEQLVAEASGLAQEIQVHDGRVQSLELALGAAREEARRAALLRNVVIAAVVLAGVLALFLVLRTH